MVFVALLLLIALLACACDTPQEIVNARAEKIRSEAEMNQAKADRDWQIADEQRAKNERIREDTRHREESHRLAEERTDQESQDQAALLEETHSDRLARERATITTTKTGAVVVIAVASLAAGLALFCTAAWYSINRLAEAKDDMARAGQVMPDVLGRLPVRDLVVLDTDGKVLRAWWLAHQLAPGRVPAPPPKLLVIQRVDYQTGEVREFTRRHEVQGRVVSYSHQIAPPDPARVRGLIGQQRALLAAEVAGRVVKKGEVGDGRLPELLADFQAGTETAQPIG